MPYRPSEWRRSEMSCGKPHQTPCTDVLGQVYSYLDGELGEPDAVKIRQHLGECRPCLREYGLEETVKRLVRRHAGEHHVPAGLRADVLRRLFGLSQIRTRFVQFVSSR
jgi:anti-sigma factor (TIGR02949 family)